MSSFLPSPARRAERGAVSWVTLLLLVGLVGGSYLAVVWVPIYWVHVEVKTTVRDYINQAVKNQDDEVLIQRMTQKLASLDQVNDVDRSGKRIKVPAVDVAPEDVTWERDREADPPTLHVAFTYRREIEYPFLDRWTEKEFSVDITQDIAIPNWGPAR